MYSTAGASKHTNARAEHSNKAVLSRGAFMKQVFWESSKHRYFYSLPKAASNVKVYRFVFTPLLRLIENKFLSQKWCFSKACF